MKDLTHVDQKTATTVTNLMKQPNNDAIAAQAKEAQEIVKYYKENYDFVQLVTCENCGADLCLWVLDRDQVQANMTNHHLGLRRITIGDNLMSSRKRLDGAMGYECNGQVPNPNYDAHVKEVNAFNKKQEELKKADKPYEPHQEITEPKTIRCGADTRLSPVEKGILQETAWAGSVPSIDPHIEAKIKQKIIATNFKPEVKDLDNGDSSIEGFTHKTIKGN